MANELTGLLAEVSSELAQIPGVVAVVLGGSWARGTHTSESDVDLGIYYRSEALFDVAHLDRVATRLDDRRRAGLVTPIGGWGPWINGGGWLTIGGRDYCGLLLPLRRVPHTVSVCAQRRVLAQRERRGVNGGGIRARARTLRRACSRRLCPAIPGAWSIGASTGRVSEAGP